MPGDDSLSKDTTITINILDDKITVRNVFATTPEDCDKCQTVTALINRSRDDRDNMGFIAAIFRFYDLADNISLTPRDLEDIITIIFSHQNMFSPYDPDSLLSGSVLIDITEYSEERHASYCTSRTRLHHITCDNFSYRNHHAIVMTLMTYVITIYLFLEVSCSHGRKA